MANKAVAWYNGISFASKYAGEDNGQLIMLTNGDAYLQQGIVTFCSRFECADDETFISKLFILLNRYFKLCVQTEGEADDIIHDFMHKFPRMTDVDTMVTVPSKQTLNLNAFVKVKLRPKGAEIYYHQNDTLGLTPLMPVIDEHGYTKMQLWDIMRLFGKELSPGVELPFEAEMILEGE